MKKKKWNNDLRVQADCCVGEQTSKKTSCTLRKVSLGFTVFHINLPRNGHPSSVICQAANPAGFQPFILHNLGHKAAWTYTNLSALLLNQSLLQPCEESKGVEPIF